MKTWIIVAIVVGILALGSVFAFNMTGNTISEETCQTGQVSECNSGNCPNSGECTKQNNCGNPGCGVQETGSCGCGK